MRVTVNGSSAVNLIYFSNFRQALNPSGGEMPFWRLPVDLKVLVFYHLSSTKTVTSW